MWVYCIYVWDEFGFDSESFITKLNAATRCSWVRLRCFSRKFRNLLIPGVFQLLVLFNVLVIYSPVMGSHIRCSISFFLYFSLLIHWTVLSCCFGLLPIAFQDAPITSISSVVDMASIDKHFKKLSIKGFCIYFKFSVRWNKWTYFSYRFIRHDFAAMPCLIFSFTSYVSPWLFTLIFFFISNSLSLDNFYFSL